MSGIVCSSIFVRGNQRTKEWYEKCYKKYFNGSDILVTGDDINWCKKHIIPPSTYSWWSAYLSGDESTVIAPDIWFT